MKSLITTVLFSLLVVGSKGDVSQNINYSPFGSFRTIQSPQQSLLPPTLENPIRDYTVGLVPPPVGPAPRTNIETYQRTQASPFYQSPNNFAAGLITPYSGFSIPLRTAIHHQTYHSTNLLQPQVYQPKTHHHHQRQQNNFNGRGFAISKPTQLYAEPPTPSAIRQQFTSAFYTSGLAQRAPRVLGFNEHVRPNAQHATLLSRPVSASGVNIIQGYPSVSFGATGLLPQLGSTLDFGNVKYQPELLYIINDVLKR